MTTTLLLATAIILLVILLALIAAHTMKTDVQFNKLIKSIRDSVEPKFLDISPASKSLVELAVEVWRLEKRLSKASDSFSSDQNKAFENSTSKLHRFLDTNDITFIDYTGQKYNEGLNLDILSIEKDSSISESIIKETHEPAVLHKGQVVKKAKVVVLEKQ